jgi:single-strand DNA-binding protein
VSRSVNKVMLIGNLGADPEIRTIPKGSRVAQFSLATSRSWNTDGGQKQEKTEWHRCVVWNARREGTGLVEVIEKYVKKGDRVYVEGSIEYRSYEDKKDGTTKYVTEIKVRDLMMLTGRGEGGEGGGRRAAAPAAAASGREAGAPKGKEGSDSFGDFPEALDEEDDDLPF